MQYELLQVAEVDVVLPDNLRFGPHNQLWLFDGQKHAVTSIDLTTFEIRHHWQDPSFWAFVSFGELGVVGTEEGRVQTFSLNNPAVIQAEWIVRDKYCIECIEFIPETGALLIVSGQEVHQFLRTGVRTGVWEIPRPTYKVKWVARSRSIWTLCSGIQILFIDSGAALELEDGHWQYCNFAISASGNVACFGASVDIFTPHGEKLESISGDFNGGTYGKDGRLILKETCAELATPVTVNSGDRYDVVSTCDRFAIDHADKLLAALKGGKLFLFAIQ